MDTIPLMLLLVGAYDRSYLTKFKRLNSYGYEEEDFEVLRKFLLSTKTITVTPGVLVEAGNFLENNPHYSKIIVRNISLLAKLNEVYIEKARILNCELVFQLAFTDTSLLLLAKNNGASVITRDRKLWAACKKIGVDVFHLDQVLSAGDLISQRG
jgi:hypothetical protein